MVSSSSGARGVLPNLWWTIPFGALLFSGCAREPELAAERHARQALSERDDAVRLVLEGNPFGMDQARLNALVANEMAEGISGMDPKFVTSAARAGAPEPHLVVILNPLDEPAAERVCAAPGDVATGPAGQQVKVVAAFCEEGRPLGLARNEGFVAGPTDRRFRRLLWRTANDLFPDDYAETYGFGILPRSVDFGLGGSVGED